jgi:hypothetical protein
MLWPGIRCVLIIRKGYLDKRPVVDLLLLFFWSFRFAVRRPPSCLRKNFFASERLSLDGNGFDATSAKARLLNSLFTALKGRSSTTSSR